MTIVGNIRARWEEWTRPEISYKLLFILLTCLLYPITLTLIEGPVDLSLIYPTRYLKVGSAWFRDGWAISLLFIVWYWIIYCLLWKTPRKALILCALSYCIYFAVAYLWLYGMEAMINLIVSAKKRPMGLTLAEHGAIMLISVGLAIALVEEIIPSISKRWKSPTTE